MATKKPRKATTISAYGNAPKGSSGVSKPRTFTGAKPPAPKPPTQPPTPAAPALAAVPKVASGPPPASLQSGADRISTNYQYGTTVGDVNTQLRSLAAQYGAAPKVTQYGYDPTKNVGGAYGDTQTTLDVAPNQPGSTMEALLRNLGLTKGNVNDTNLAQNTFFGSRRIGQLGDADSQFTGDSAAAKRAYDDAVNALINGPNGILAARGVRNTNLTNADIADQQAALAVPPEPVAETPYAAPAAPAEPPPPTISAGGSHSQGTTGGPQKKKPKKKK